MADLDDKVKLQAAQVEVPLAGKRCSVCDVATPSPHTILDCLAALRAAMLTHTRIV